MEKPREALRTTMSLVVYAHAKMQRCNRNHGRENPAERALVEKGSLGDAGTNQDFFLKVLSLQHRQLLNHFSRTTS